MDERRESHSFAQAGSQAGGLGKTAVFPECRAYGTGGEAMLVPTTDVVG